MATALCTVLAMQAVGSIASGCYREQPPPVMTTRDPLVVTSLKCGADDRQHPPIEGDDGKRMRSHSAGSLSATHRRRSWTGPAVPPHVPHEVESLELFLLDEVEAGHLAFYREPYGLGSCQLGDSTNCAYEARLYDRKGRQKWGLRLDEVMSRPDQLEIQDIRFAGGVLYFNEACQSYSSGAHGKCSWLVAVDPVEARVLWRTSPLVSNGRFFVRGCYIVAGYGFTSEPDAVHLVDRGSGRVLQKLAVSSAPQQYTLVGDALEVELYSGTTRRYLLAGFDTADGKLQPLDPDEQIYGGTGYGGVGYGGASYGGQP